LREPQQAQLRWSTLRIESMVHCTPPDRNVPLQLYFTAARLQEGFASKPLAQVLLDTSMKHCCLAVPMACTNHQVPRGKRLPASDTLIPAHNRESHRPAVIPDDVAFGRSVLSRGLNVWDRALDICPFSAPIPGGTHEIPLAEGMKGLLPRSSPLFL